MLAFPRQRVAPDSLAANNLNESLARQLEAIQQVLALNKEIAVQLKTNGEPALNHMSAKHSSMSNASSVEVPASNVSSVRALQTTPTRLKSNPSLKALKQALVLSEEMAEQLRQAPKQQGIDMASRHSSPNVGSCDHAGLSTDICSSVAVSMGTVEPDLRKSCNGDLRTPLIIQQPESPGNGESCLPKPQLRSQVSMSSNAEPAAMQSFFPDVDLKQTILQTLNRHTYKVEEFYHETGYAQAIARNSTFQSLGLIVIMLNMVWIGIETEYNHGLLVTQQTTMYFVVDNVFCFFFAFEIVTRFLAFKDKAYAFNDQWFWFDSVLVFAMILETVVLVITSAMYNFVERHDTSPKGIAILRILRVARLARVFRASRLLRAFSELLILLRGIAAGFRSVLAVLCLLLMIVYVFAIVFVLMLRDTGAAKGQFNHLYTAMNELVIQILCGPDPDLMMSLLDYDWIYYAIFLLFLVINVLTVMNLLIGILCDAVSTVAQNAKDVSFADEVDAQIDRLTQKLDLDSDGLISAPEFEVIIHDPVLSHTLDELGVDLVAVADFAKFIYTQTDNISYANFASMVSQFRGNKTASVGNVASLMRHMTSELIQMESRLAFLSFGAQTGMVAEAERPGSADNDVSSDSLASEAVKATLTGKSDSPASCLRDSMRGSQSFLDSGSTRRTLHGQSENQRASMRRYI